MNPHLKWGFIFLNKLCNIYIKQRDNLLVYSKHSTVNKKLKK